MDLKREVSTVELLPPESGRVRQRCAFPDEQNRNITENARAHSRIRTHTPEMSWTQLTQRVFNWTHAACHFSLTFASAIFMIMFALDCLLYPYNPVPFFTYCTWFGKAAGIGFLIYAVCHGLEELRRKFLPYGSLKSGEARLVEEIDLDPSKMDSWTRLKTVGARQRQRQRKRMRELMLQKMQTCHESDPEGEQSRERIRAMFERWKAEDGQRESAGVKPKKRAISSIGEFDEPEPPGNEWYAAWPWAEYYPCCGMKYEEDTYTSGRTFYDSCDYFGSCPCEYHRLRELKAKAKSPCLSPPPRPQSPLKRSQVNLSKNLKTLCNDRPDRVRPKNLEKEGAWRSFGNTQLAMPTSTSMSASPLPLPSTSSQSSHSHSHLALNPKPSRESCFKPQRPGGVGVGTGNVKRLVEYFSSMPLSLSPRECEGSDLGTRSRRILSPSPDRDMRIKNMRQRFVPNVSKSPNVPVPEMSRTPPNAKSGGLGLGRMKVPVRQFGDCNN